jgi:pyruvate/2-oxoglutarate dehydrogenase complex dihydrolipoamide acyltransferase (E2) component
MFSKNIKYKGQLPSNTWRKIAINTWKPDYGGKILSRVELNPEPALELLERVNAKSKEKVSLTHLLGSILGKLQEEFPLLRSTIRGKRIFEREGCDVFFHVSRVNSKGEEDLSGKVIRDMNELSIEEVSVKLNKEGRKIKTKEDTTFKTIKKLVSFVPNFLVSFILDISSFIHINLNLWSPLLGTKRDTFGSMMLTNVGVFGVKESFVPFVRYSGIHAICCMGAVHDDVVLRDGEIRVGKKLILNWSLDHRLIDGSTAGKMAKRLVELFENPEQLR